MYVANNGGAEPGYIQRVDRNGAVETLYNDCDDQPFHGPNDLVFDAHGGFYFTDPAYATREGVQSGHVYYALADGTGVKRLQYYFYFPNGIALSADGSTLYVNESLTSRIWAIPIESPGVLAQVDAGARAYNPRNGWPNTALLTTVPQPAQPDGLCLDEAGNLLIAAHGSGSVSVHAPDGDSPLSNRGRRREGHQLLLRRRRLPDAVHHPVGCGARCDAPMGQAGAAAELAIVADMTSRHRKRVRIYTYAPVAQRIEHRSSEPRVGGSNPSGRAITRRIVSLPFRRRHG